jgi:myo-inositol 2-dehydrogenase/D-chiro-inositol 1-dehydrogenase
VVANRTPDNAVASNADGVHAAKPLYFFIERYTDAFIAEMKDFIACLLDQGKTPPVTGLDGRIPVVMGLAALKSYREHRPVKLSEID